MREVYWGKDQEVVRGMEHAREMCLDTAAWKLFYHNHPCQPMGEFPRETKCQRDR